MMYACTSMPLTRRTCVHVPSMSRTCCAYGCHMTSLTPLCTRAQTWARYIWHPGSGLVRILSDPGIVRSAEITTFGEKSRFWRIWRFPGSDRILARIRSDSGLAGFGQISGFWLQPGQIAVRTWPPENRSPEVRSGQLPDLATCQKVLSGGRILGSGPYI